jgi:hypothetical protein
MVGLLQLTGMPQAIPNTVTEDVRFVLNVSAGNPIICVAKYGVATQIASGFGTAVKVLRMALNARQGWERVSTEQLQEIQVLKDHLTGDITLHLTTALGIPHIFQIPSQTALDIADRLRTEAMQNRPIGNA